MKKIILDCDPGMDDSMAIVMAAKSEALDVLAVTTVNGNYPVDVTSKNARKVLEGRTFPLPAAWPALSSANLRRIHLPMERTDRQRLICRNPQCRWQIWTRWT